MSVYVLVAIVRKRLAIPSALHTMLQVLSLTLFEREPLRQLLADSRPESRRATSSEQLFLFGS